MVSLLECLLLKLSILNWSGLKNLKIKRLSQIITELKEQGYNVKIRFFFLFSWQQEIKYY
ncbi:MAG: hypothetical protein LC105_03935 [Chitinophagales bacterium]|nr:hypothetical protein [Chitinophagales bacterium]